MMMLMCVEISLFVLFCYLFLSFLRGSKALRTYECSFLTQIWLCECSFLTPIRLYFYSETSVRTVDGCALTFRDTLNTTKKKKEARIKMTTNTLPVSYCSARTEDKTEERGEETLRLRRASFVLLLLLQTLLLLHLLLLLLFPIREGGDVFRRRRILLTTTTPSRYSRARKTQPRNASRN